MVTLWVPFPLGRGGTLSHSQMWSAPSSVSAAESVGTGVRPMPPARPPSSTETSDPSDGCYTDPQSPVITISNVCPAPGRCSIIYASSMQRAVVHHLNPPLGAWHSLLQLLMALASCISLGTDLAEGHLPWVKVITRKPASHGQSVLGCAGLAPRPQFGLCLQGLLVRDSLCRVRSPPQLHHRPTLRLSAPTSFQIRPELSPIKPLPTGAQPKGSSLFIIIQVLLSFMASDGGKWKQ